MWGCGCAVPSGLRDLHSYIEIMRVIEELVLHSIAAQHGLVIKPPPTVPQSMEVWEFFFQTYGIDIDTDPELLKRLREAKVI